ncbi:cytochrome c oxidase assembly protein [Hydrogenophaga sp. BPS33]|uniref:cytochrome c oxidase assembly protein n=1 Tax=Hydrogenophaga sp. BPS33 TaxID=2651974 RepID=UPI0013201301|nr:cytochrome c oxidase assembly protein [Hydrogenophaga sp. BPS33]QHE88576.1 cytochrome c oxidase assembly protein [Hydrogenophaga sp. BPS33]
MRQVAGPVPPVRPLLEVNALEELKRWVPYCGEAPGPEVWLSRWNLDPVLWVVLLLLLVRLLWPVRVGSRATPRRLLSLRGAWALTFVLYVSPLCALSSAFFTVRVVHHLALVLVLAPLLVFGLEPFLRRWPVSLWLSTAVSVVVFWVWHAPGAYAQALSSDGVYAAMQLSLLVSAMAFWLAVRRAGPPLAIGAVLVTTVLMGLLGALITFATRPLYPPHFASAIGWGVAPLDDQQLAGIIMWAPGSVAYLAAAMWIGWRWMNAERARGVHGARGGLA